jgi:hypothetical protein
MRVPRGNLLALALLAGTAPPGPGAEPPGFASVADDLSDEEFQRIERGAREHVAALARAVRAAAGVETPAREALAALLDRRAAFEEHGTRVTASELTAAFDTWSSATRRLPPSQRSDALLLADRVMDVVSRYTAIGPKQSDVARVRIAGAEFLHDRLGDSFTYTHTFLLEARRIAPPGVARDRVLLGEMEIGFDLAGQCSAGDDVTAKIIAAGEGLLRRNRDPQVRAPAHLMIADAYATIVSLANGDAADYFDAKAYAPREEAARRAAIAHYRAGLALDPNPPDAEFVRRDLKRLLDGEVPSLAGGAARQRMFYCVYD